MLSVITWHDWSRLGAVFTSQRARHGIASVWGAGQQAAAPLGFGLVTAGSSASALLTTSLPPAWTGAAQ